MRLVITRNQKAQTGLLGGHKGMTFLLSCLVQLTQEEQQLIAKYKVENLILLDSPEMIATFGKVQDLKIGDLVRGVGYEVNRVKDVIDGENLVKNACATFKNYLDVMASFGGQEIIDF